VLAWGERAVSLVSECAKNSARGLDSVDDANLRQAVSTFIETYNNEWNIEHLGHRIARGFHRGDGSGHRVTLPYL
jgi:hypothetical protein